MTKTDGRKPLPGTERKEDEDFIKKEIRRKGQEYIPDEISEEVFKKNKKLYEKLAKE